MIEGNLEVKVQMKQQGWTEAEKRKSQKKKLEKRKSQKKEDQRAQKGRKVVTLCFSIVLWLRTGEK